MGNTKLALWQKRLEENEGVYAQELSKMDRRESIYKGSDAIRRLVPGDKKARTRHVRNIAAELIEAQVNSTIPQPKVTPKRPQDTDKAKMIEDLLRNELDRMPFEMMNDLAERTVPIQGGTAFFVEWDSGRRSHTGVGELAVTMLHPKQLIPQEGIYTGISDMDYFIIKLPQTRETVARRYGVNLPETEKDAAGGFETHTDSGTDMVTQYLAYYKNDAGGIGVYSWAQDTELMDYQSYQGRQRKRCKSCGLEIPLYAEKEGQKKCPACGGGRLQPYEAEYEEVFLPASASLAGGRPPMSEPVRVPCYKPNLYPVILQKNVSVYGRFLGDSDIDKISDQQNTANRIEQKIIDKLLKSGSYLVLPEQADIRADAEDMKVIRPETAAAAGQIGVKDLQGNIEQDMRYLEQIYQEARQITGITDSFQGRKDSSATSGKAKEFSAAQAAGRMESKRVMKNAAYAEMFEVMFKYLLAYQQEPRPVASKDARGNPEYKIFSRLDFLEQDEAGQWYWNDQFLFSCDTTAPLASNREAMWQETRMNFQTGAFGDPANLETLILFWKKMEMLHYPGAGETRVMLEEKLKAQTGAMAQTVPPSNLGQAAPGEQRSGKQSIL